MKTLKELQTEGKHAFITNCIELLRCKSEWSTLVSALGTSSPVCVMLHPSDRMTAIISKMSESDVTTDPANL